MITISGEGLTIDDVAAVSKGAKVALSTDPAVLGRIDKSRDVVRDAIANGQQIYGVTTLFGGMADKSVGPDQIAEVQKIALWQHKSTTGPRLSDEDVRATMLLRANSLMKGVSGVRLELIERYVQFLNAGAHPHVYKHGSIGASGDLVPLSYVGAAITGLDPAFKVDLGGKTLSCHAALAQLGLKPLPLGPKEGLAMNNGTAACTGVAANCVARAKDLTALTLGIHALIAQALLATDQSFYPFIHAVKPHPGQVWTAQQLGALVEGSKIIRSEAFGDRSHRAGKLIQDRYSLRCLPQYLGPIIDALAIIAGQIETEANSGNDNPLVDPDSGEIFHTGNFLGQYTAIAMDQLRYHVALLAKHIDVQIALLVTPEFSYGLSPSLVGNMASGLNVGFKSLQLVCNSLMPLITYHGHSIADRYPTHAEQFNQNINSQAMNAANLAREQLDLFEHLIANALLFAVQAVELRAHSVSASYDARTVLSPATSGFYAAVRSVAEGPPNAQRPLLWDDFDGFIQPRVEAVLADIKAGGQILQSLPNLRRDIRARGATVIGSGA